MNAREAERMAKALEMYRAASYEHTVHEDATPEFYTETQKSARVLRERGLAVGSIAGAKTHRVRWALVEWYDRDGSLTDTLLSASPMCGTTRSTGHGGRYQNYYQLVKDAQPTCAKCSKS